ncbi:uncharacterized protein LOC132739379 [Ruditapes philippinarum]|uniref:uncharacterized protein LOC132739379 n=1 Tax=Ruditapes philippinarum TaxID=129788 RepID=UPI00295B5000|nr:uncharacterized protein LOC132739379 [Ruditapes philippinarum]
MDIHMFIVMMATRLIYADLIMQVTRDDCERSIDLSYENRVTINYADSDFVNMTGFCIIEFTTNSSDEMICITSDRTHFIDIICKWSLSYHIGGYSSYGEQYSCNDFNRKPLCKGTRRVSLAYSDNYLFSNVTISVTLFSKTVKQTTTTTRRPSWSSWSSWSGQSSWSSWTSDNDSYGKSHKGNSAIIGIIIGVIVGVLLFVVCCVLIFYKKPTGSTQNDTPVQIQYRPESRNADTNTSLITDSARESANPSRSHLEEPESQGPPSYEEVEKHEDIYKYKGEQLAVPSYPENNVTPTAPPPPYPGV